MFCLYTKYYFVPWPESQKFLELDTNGEHTILTESSDIMVECDWVDSLDSNELS